MSLIVVKNTKEFIKEKNFNCSSEIFDDLNKKVESILLTAIKRADINKRKTLMVQDL